MLKKSKVKFMIKIKDKLCADCFIFPTCIGSNWNSCEMLRDQVEYTIKYIKDFFSRHGLSNWILKTLRDTSACPVCGHDGEGYLILGTNDTICEYCKAYIRVIPDKYEKDYNLVSLEYGKRVQVSTLSSVGKPFKEIYSITAAAPKIRPVNIKDKSQLSFKTWSMLYQMKKEGRLENVDTESG